MEFRTGTPGRCITNGEVGRLAAAQGNNEFDCLMASV